MNIFEQYGIKEVADVVLYEIELDKNDEEIYIPLMYFDTLKVSSIEQSADQTTARGGIGNPELIAWDFGKEITVTLEDALYTPASQSLMWGGKFGVNKTKIMGVWNPYEYEKDSFGRPLYVKRTPVESGEDYDAENYVIHVAIDGQALHFIVPKGEGTTGIIQVYDESIELPSQAVGYNYVWFSYLDTVEDKRTMYCLVHYQDGYAMAYLEMTEPIVSGVISPTDVDFSNIIFFTCPCDGDVKWMKIEQGEGHYKYYRLEDEHGDWGPAHWKEDQLIPTDYKCPSDNTIYESEELPRPVQKYAVEGNLSSDVSWYANTYPERAYIKFDNFGDFEYHAYQFVTDTLGVEEVCYYQDVEICDDGENIVRCTADNIDANGYIWEESDVIMNSLEGEQETYYLRDTDVRYRIRHSNNLREIAIEYSADSGNEYYAKLNVYRTVKFPIINGDGEEEEQEFKILVGTFYIIDDWNQNSSAIQENIYEINSGLENVPYLERMELCTAPQTFAIDADKNIRCNNYRYMHDYDNTELTVFYNPKTMKPYEANSESYIKKSGEVVVGNLTIIKQNECYYKWTRSKAGPYDSLGYQITVDAEHFPGTYRLVGETYARARKDGQDQRYQFEIPLCKMSASTNLTLESSGDPTTFSMSFRVLRKDDGTMMKLTQYSVQSNPETGSTSVTPSDGLPNPNAKLPQLEQNESVTIVEKWGAYIVDRTNIVLKIANPDDNRVIYIDQDVDAPFGGVQASVQPITASRLAENVVSAPIPVGEDSDQIIVNYNLIENPDFTANELVIYKESTYDISRIKRVVAVYSNGQEAYEISSETVPIQSDVVARVYLNPDQYTYNATPIVGH